MSPQRLSRISGVHATDLGVDEIEEQAEQQGWRCWVLDGTDVEDKHAFLDSCEEAFDLPDWFGRNWDALEESLRDLDVDGAKGVVVAWSGWGEFAEADPKDFATAVDIWRSVLRSWSADGRRCGVLLVGEGPDVDVDAL